MSAHNHCQVLMYTSCPPRPLPFLPHNTQTIIFVGAWQGGDQHHCRVQEASTSTSLSTPNSSKHRSPCLLELGMEWSASLQSARHPRPLPSPHPPLPQTQISMPLGAWQGGDQHYCRVQETSTSTSLPPPPPPQISMPLGAWHEVISITAECKRHPPPLPSPPPPPKSPCLLELGMRWSASLQSARDTHVHFLAPLPLDTDAPWSFLAKWCSSSLWEAPMYTSYPTAPSPPPPHLQNTDLHASWGLARGWSASLQEAPCPLPFTYPPHPPPANTDLHASWSLASGCSSSPREAPMHITRWYFSQAATRHASLQYFTCQKI